MILPQLLEQDVEKDHVTFYRKFNFYKGMTKVSYGATLSKNVKNSSLLLHCIFQNLETNVN